MPVEVEGPGGVIVEFPDGTSERTMRAAMQQRWPAKGSLAASKNPVAAYVGRDSDKRVAEYQAGQDRGRAARANPVKLGSRIVGDLIEPAQNALGTLRDAYRGTTALQAEGPPNSFAELASQTGRQLSNDGKLVGGLAGLAASPITGPINAFVGAAARGAEHVGIGDEQTNKSIINTAMMGARPGAGAPANAFAAAPARVAPEVGAFAKRAKPDVSAMKAKAAEYRAQGIDPALVEVADDTARGLVRATASRPTPARQAATDFRDKRALDLPSRMSGQARRVMSSDPRTPAKIAEELAAGRKADADAQFGAVRNEPVQPTEDMVAAMRTEHARDAIAEAVRRERDPDARRILAGLRDQAFDAPGQMPMTVGAADRISRVLAGKAKAASRAGDNDLATTLGNLSRDIREPARAQSTGYADALKGYAKESSALEAADRGEDFLHRNTDEFVSDVGQMDSRELELARATGRRAVERAAGENISAAPGVARKIALAPEQQARNRALLGDTGAKALQSGMSAEESLVRNANDIAPRGGSQTQLRGQDAESMLGAVGTVRKGLSGDWIGVATDWLKTRGISDETAQAITERAIDPAQLDELIGQIEKAMGPADALLFLRSLSNPNVLVPTVQAGVANEQAR